MNKNILGGIYLSVAASVWGSMYVVSKYVLEFIPPISLVWFRYIISFSVLFAFLKITKVDKDTKVEKKDLLLIIWIAFIGYFISIILQFIGTKLSDASTGALLTSSTPVFIVIFAYFVLGEKFTIRKIVSLLIASIGVVVVIGLDISLDTYFYGCIILVGAAVTWALLSVYIKVAAKRLPTLLVTTYAMFFALLMTTPLFIYDLITKSFYYDTKIVIGIIYLGVVATAGAFFLWNKGLELMEAGNGSLFLFLQPIVGSLLGWLMLGENLNTRFYIGGVLILIGVLVVTLEPKARYEDESTGLIDKEQI